MGRGSWPRRMDLYDQRGVRDEIPGRRNLVSKGTVVRMSLE